MGIFRLYTGDDGQSHLVTGRRDRGGAVTGFLGCNHR